MIGRIKLVLSLAGLVFAVVGIARDDRGITWAAIGILAVAVLLRLFLRRRADSEGDPGAGDAPP